MYEIGVSSFQVIKTQSLSREIKHSLSRELYTIYLALELSLFPSYNK